MKQPEGNLKQNLHVIAKIVRIQNITAATAIVPSRWASYNVKSSEVLRCRLEIRGK